MRLSRIGIAVVAIALVSSASESIEAAPVIVAPTNDTVDFLNSQWLGGPGSDGGSGGSAGSSRSGGSAGGGGGGSAAPPRPSGAPMVTTVFLVQDAEGEPCIQLGEISAEMYSQQTRSEGTGSIRTAPEGVQHYEAQGYARCAGPDAEPVEVVDPAVVVWQLWRDRVRLPEPTVSSTPPFAVTGMPVFLEIGGPPVPEVVFGPEEALGYTVRFQVSSVYEVDWGDGEVTTTSSSGGPWPDGDVRHTYQYEGDGNVVTVTQRWTATWTATGPGGTASGAITTPLYTTGQLPLPIDEIQAVVEY